MSKHSAEYSPDELVGELLKASVLLEREGKRVVSAHGLSQQQFVALKAVEESGPVMQKDLTSAYVVEKSGLSKSVAKLAALGLVERQPSAEDGRAHYLRITDAGQKVVQDCMAAFEAFNTAWASRLSDKHLKSAIKSLRKLNEFQPPKLEART